MEIADDQHDAEVGFNWYTLEMAIERMLGVVSLPVAFGRPLLRKEVAALRDRTVPRCDGRRCVCTPCLHASPAASSLRVR
jgi:hypothetical protein